MKLNLKKLCLLLILCIGTFHTMPKAFAANDEPVKQLSVRQRAKIPFTAQEDETIKNKVREYKNQGCTINWKEIGDKLGHKANSCRQRWYAYLAHNSDKTEIPVGIRNIPFTVSEDLEILDHIQRWGPCRWDILSKKFDNIHGVRSYSCRFYKQLYPAIQSKEIIKKFKKDECEKVIDLVKKCNKHTTWNDIAKQVPDHKDIECRNLYISCINLNLNKILIPEVKIRSPRVQFTIAEDLATLNHFFANGSHNWTSIKNEFGNIRDERSYRCRFYNQLLNAIKNKKIINSYNPDECKKIIDLVEMSDKDAITWNDISNKIGGIYKDKQCMSIYLKWFVSSTCNVRFDEEEDNMSLNEISNCLQSTSDQNNQDITPVQNDFLSSVYDDGYNIDDLFTPDEDPGFHSERDS